MVAVRQENRATDYTTDTVPIKRAYLKGRNKKISERLDQLSLDSYKAYLRSSLWRTNRSNFYSWYKATFGTPKCEFCSTENKLNVHHRTYRNLGKELKGELLLLCTDCHLEVHKFEREEKVHLWKATTRVGRRIRRSLLDGRGK